MAKFIIYDNFSCELVSAYIDGLTCGKRWEVTISEAGSARSMAQNNLYWVWLTDISNQMSKDPNINVDKGHMHIFFKKKFLPYTVKTIGGILIENMTSTKKLGIKKFTEYLTEIEVYTLRRGYTLPFPDIYAEAMGKQ